MKQLTLSAFTLKRQKQLSKAVLNEADLNYNSDDELDEESMKKSPIIVNPEVVDETGACDENDAEFEEIVVEGKNKLCHKGNGVVQTHLRKFQGILKDVAKLHNVTLAGNAVNTTVLGVSVEAKLLFNNIREYELEVKP